MVAAEVVVREYDPVKDAEEVAEVERRCEVGPSGKMLLFTDLLGDPLCRIRHSPACLMLVAEIVENETQKGHIVGMIRGLIKSVTCGKKLPRDPSSDGHDRPQPVPVLTKAAYILGLRVAPTHRRLGLGFTLVSRMEDWFKQNGADYAYLATENDNYASVSLFTHKCGYSKFRTPSILVRPVFAHPVRVTQRATIIGLAPPDAEALYRRRFSTTEFFPRDIDSVLNNKLSLGTFLAVPSESGFGPDSWPGPNKFLSSPPESWAMVSVWNCAWKLEVRGASRVKTGLARTTRVLDRVMPWAKIPSFPDLFGPFGVHFMYGLCGEGPRAIDMVRALSGFVHNMARKHIGCAVVATEVAGQEPLRLGVPHWKRLSCDEDLWCVKRLADEYGDGSVGDWTKSLPGISIFVDPREF